MSDPSGSPGPSSIDVLAAKRTLRPNPLNNFQVYTGGWNFTNMNYLASAGYAGMAGFVISLLWVILGLGIFIVAGCMFFCCKHNLKPVPDFDSFGNYTTLGLLILFTVVTIVGCGALFTGQEALHSDLSAMFTYLMTQFAAAANASVASVPPIAASQAAQAATAMEQATNSTLTTIHNDLDSIRSWLIILASTMLVLALIGLVFVACHFRPIIYTLVAAGWLLVVGTWILCGVFLLVDAVIGDTCVAMQEWVQNPRGGTSFDMVMKCPSNKSSSSHLSISSGIPPPIEDDQIQDAHYKFLNDIDQQNGDFNLINNPNPDGHQTYSLWVRKKSIQRKTSTPPATTPDSCTQLRNSFVPIFTTIATNSCPGMCRNAKWVWVALVTLSTGSMVSICLWIVFTRRSTMRLTKVQAPGNPLPIQFEESKEKSEAGSSSNNTAYSTSHSSPIKEISLDVRRRSNISKGDQ